MIASLQNEQVKRVAALHQKKARDAYGQYLIEGKRFVREALGRKASIKKIYFCDIPDIADLKEQAESLNIFTEQVTYDVMRKMSATIEPQGILAVVEKKEPDWQDVLPVNGGMALILDNIQDPGNLGTILRTALAADVRQIILTKGTVDLYNPKVMRGSMGAIFSQTILTDKEPSEVVNFFKSQNFTLAVSSMEGNSIFREQIYACFPLVLVIGNEAFGVSDTFLKAADIRLSIPMFNRVESLNAAMAAGIFLYEIRRQGQFL